MTPETPQNNFAFLAEYDPIFQQLANAAERSFSSDPNTTLIKLRQLGEALARVKDAQSRVNNLTQSILAKAFRGELTADWRAQNPDLISGDSSAEALLEKIKSEREVLESTKKAVKRKKAKV
ncbi:hypothetical protein [Amphritea pacifica]|nr:hypothetical protein [Amphritea pacifica]MBN1007518.1 hypothetical protein [Amphritea pacifica]